MRTPTLKGRSKVNEFSAIPIVPRVGGKGRLLHEILPAIRPYLEGRRYVEPLLGGGAVALALGQHPGKTLLADSCMHLMNLYERVRNNPDGIWKLVSDLFREGKDAYLKDRETWNEGIDDGQPGAAALYLRLARGSFNGLWRENQAGKMNVPYGGERKVIPDLNDVMRVATALQGATLFCEPAVVIVKTLGEGDLAYLDPPYLTKKSNAFVSYGMSKWTWDDLGRLLVAIRAAVERGARVLLSQPDDPLVRDAMSSLGDLATYHSVRSRRSVGAASNTRKEAPELLIAFGYVPRWLGPDSAEQLRRAPENVKV